jgi:hypothetical protein
MASNVIFNIDCFLKKWNKLNHFVVFSIRIYNNFHYIESEEKRMLEPMLTCIPFKNLGLLYSRIGTRARAEPHQNFRPEPEPYKNNAAPQHCVQLNVKI